VNVTSSSSLNLGLPNATKNMTFWMYFFFTRPIWILLISKKVIICLLLRHVEPFFINMYNLYMNLNIGSRGMLLSSGIQAKSKTFFHIIIFICGFNVLECQRNTPSATYIFPKLTCF
jgi:hypothetical protein